MSANLSVIKEDTQIVLTKGIGGIHGEDEVSGDSGVVSANSSADVSTNSDTTNVPPGTLKKKESNIIILFQALNEGRKESTFVSSNKSKAKCNISGIAGAEQHKLTIDSDGKHNIGPTRNLIVYSDFDSSFDDSFLQQKSRRAADEKTTSNKDKDKLDTSMIDLNSLPTSKFLTDVLPKLPTMSNGIKLLGVAETNPLIRCEDVYKLRYLRPDRPIGSSEIWEDRTTLRMTVFGKLVSDELQMTNCRFETACYIPGIQEKDAIGTEAVKGVLESHDIANLTAKPFLQRKASGKRR